MTRSDKHGNFFLEKSIHILLDFEHLALRTPHIVADLPAGGSRFLQAADGLEMTIKSGQVIFENGALTDALPGQLLRGQRPDPRISA